jgi:hypothetical protein
MGTKKKFFFGLLFIVILFLLFELFARAYYYRKPAKSSFASYELLRSVKHAITDTRKKIDNTNHYTVRPQLSKAENDSIAAETRRANYYIYYPWVEFSYGNIHGQYINAFQRVRKSIPDVSSDAPNPIKVWFLGGSTMFGFNLTDAETIPSAFVREYQKHEGRPIKVMNYGTPNYFSYQELIQLADNLYRGNVPDIVIMLDGLNEGAAPFASYYRNPWNTPQIQQLLDPDLYHYPQGYDYYHFPDSSKIQQVCQKIFDNYIENIASARSLSEAYHFKLYCFWQPVPFFDYPNQAKDLFCSKSPIYQFDYLCPQIKKKSEDINYLFYLGNMLENAHMPFIESGHYTPWMCDSIALRMLDKIFPQKLHS